MEKRKAVTIGDKKYAIVCSDGFSGLFRIDVWGPNYYRRYSGPVFKLESMLIAVEKNLQAHFNSTIETEVIFEKLGFK